MNIVGEGLPDAIIDQVNQRQKIYGSGYTPGVPRTNEQIIYLNANTSWCKLVSSVNIPKPQLVDNKTIQALKQYSGNELAKKFVLFNGTNSDITDQRAGINLNRDLDGGNNAYGIGGTDFGLRPMMGIQSANIKNLTRGSIRNAEIRIKAWNKQQFDIIDVLYLRVGFSVLLEWGHSMYYNNDGVLQKGNDNDNNSLALDFLNGKISYAAFLAKIQKQRLDSCGNYDAMFGRVVNFHWSFLKDGSYDITLDLISVGDVVESFKINVLNKGIEKDKNEVLEDGETLAQLSFQELIPYYANRHEIGKMFYEIAYMGVKDKK